MFVLNYIASYVLNVVWLLLTLKLNQLMTSERKFLREKSNQKYTFSLLNFDKILSHILSVRFFQMKISSEPRCMMYDTLSISFIEWISFILFVNHATGEL